MTRSLKMLLFAFFVLTLFSCDKELPTEDLQIHFEGNFPLKDITIFDQTWFACGGQTFQSGFIVHSSLTENDAQIISINNRCLNSIAYSDGLMTTGVYAVGKRQDELWEIKDVPDQYIMNEMIAVNEMFYAVGGAGLSQGVIYTFDESLNLLETEEWPNELTFIKEVNGGYFVGGFGLLMYTDDFVQWTILDEYEDHFIDIAYSENTGILILGASGRIIRSNNGGESWDEIREPNLSGISDFSDLLITEQKIFLAEGENICVSDINSINWKKIKIESLGEINQMVENNQRVYFVTNEGKVASIAH